MVWKTSASKSISSGRRWTLKKEIQKNDFHSKKYGDGYLILLDTRYGHIINGNVNCFIGFGSLSDWCSVSSSCSSYPYFDVHLYDANQHWAAKSIWTLCDTGRLHLWKSSLQRVKLRIAPVVSVVREKCCCFLCVFQAASVSLQGFLNSMVYAWRRPNFTGAVFGENTPLVTQVQLPFFDESLRSSSWLLTLNTPRKIVGTTCCWPEEDRLSTHFMTSWQFRL